MGLAISKLLSGYRWDIKYAKGIEFYNDLEREDLLEEYFSLSFKKEIPVELLLNQKDESIFISNDQPYNEYFLLRHHNNKSGSLKFLKQLKREYLWNSKLGYY